MISVEDIHVYRGQTHVLKGVSLEVGDGEIVALIGANGAGKTTTLRTISGLIRPRTGAILYSPDKDSSYLDLTALSAEEIVRNGISHCPEGRQVFAQLTVRENLLVGAYLRKDKTQINNDVRWIQEMFPLLEERQGQQAGNLSGGEQMMLALGRALMSRPKLLVLDEPSLGLAPLIVESIFEMLQDINAKGTTILLVEQNATMALEISHRAYVMETGRISISGPSRELSRNEQISRAYLGGEFL